MATKFKNRKIERKIDSIPKRLRFLIVCEGMKTEPNYFSSFRVNAVVSIEEAAGNTRSLVRRASEVAEQEEFDQVWCVFDRDSFPPSDFNNAITSARARGFRVAYTNEAFELWYLLHFNYHTAALSRTTYSARLSRSLGHPYQKNDPNMYHQLKSLQSNAIKNAKRLLGSYGSTHNPENDNPCTTVHELVEELNKYLIP